MKKICKFSIVVAVVCWLLSVITTIALFKTIATGAVIVLGLAVILWAGLILLGTNSRCNHNTLTPFEEYLDRKKVEAQWEHLFRG